MSDRLRRPAVLAGLLLALATGTHKVAAQTAPAHSKEAFTHARFAELQAAGTLILVDIFADWCPTCAIQQTVLAEYRKRNPDVPLHTLTVDFDRQKDVVAYFRAPRQSTLILYRGTQRLWFSVAETRTEVIAQALDEAVRAR